MASPSARPSSKEQERERELPGHAHAGGEGVRGVVGLRPGARCLEGVGDGPECDAVAGAELAVDVVGAGAARGGALWPPGHEGVAPNVIEVVGVAEDGQALDRPWDGAAIDAGLE